MSGKGHHWVTKAELKKFDDEAKRLLLWARDQGARIRVTKRGHAVVYHPDGVRTACIPPNLGSANRAAQNARAAAARLFQEPKEPTS